MYSFHINPEGNPSPPLVDNDDLIRQAARAFLSFRVASDQMRLTILTEESEE
jgi:hypothetical protein